MPEIILYKQLLSNKLLYCIRIKAYTLVESFGLEQQSFEEKETLYDSNTLVKQAAKDKILEQMQDGYQDTAAYFVQSDFEMQALNSMITNDQYEQAHAWMIKLDAWIDEELEEKYLHILLEKQQAILAERYIFTKIQSNRDYEVQIRQIKYLSSLNPIMARMLIGNLPFFSPQEHSINYLCDYAKAQSRMGVIQHLDARLATLSEHQKLVYLVHLLDCIHQDQPFQLQLLEKACAILQRDLQTNANKTEYTHLLLRAAKALNSQEQLDILGSCLDDTT